MFKCMGICSECGRCQGAAMMRGANERKARMVSFPEDFQADRSMSGLGMAFDIGTTTVVGMLWDFDRRKQLAVAARTNPQNEYGMDVISRITFCNRRDGNTSILRKQITDCLNEITEESCREAGAEPEGIKKVVVCGNTTMSHIFAGYPPRSLALAPFKPEYEGAVSMSGREAMLNTGGDARITVLPNIAGHVGGDITAGLVACRIWKMKGLTLFIDIGTNGEIVLCDGKRMLACSTAAGPAFEGAFIKDGMRAADGAIEKVMIRDGDVGIKTIGNRQPQGICGSGIIDAIAQMLDNRLISGTGKLAGEREMKSGKVDERLAKLISKEDGEKLFLLAGRTDGSPISITQKDIREVQLAKGAVRTGMEMMLKELGKDVCDIDRVILAGAFGNYIDKINAVRIGLLPDVAPEKIVSAGNTAGTGTLMALASERERAMAEEISKAVEHIELADRSDFQETYMASLGF